ncbi:MAG TPA: hypothetical protein PLD23_10495 [Armatimonadota bacterium]|nr:hypothetical protein [Armatimonadota bacterium]
MTRAMLAPPVPAVLDRGSAHRIIPHPVRVRDFPVSPIHAPAVLVLAMVILGALPARPEESLVPPTYPKGRRLVSADARDWQIDIVRALFIPDAGARRIVRYIQDLGGENPKLRAFRVSRNAWQAPREIHGFYASWASRNGFHPLIEVRLGTPPGVRYGDPIDRYPRPTPYHPRLWPPAIPNTSPPFSFARPPKWEREDYAWLTAFYRPGDDGGVLVIVWVRGVHIWVWRPGHCPVGPILSEWLGLRWAPTETAPPEKVALPDRPPPGMPVPGDTDYLVRAELTKWELDAVAHDLQARAKQGPVRTPLDAFFTVIPQVVQPVSQAWVTTYRGPAARRASLLKPWVDWLSRSNWPLLHQGTYDAVPVRIWSQGGPNGGAVATFDVDDTTTVLALRGGVNLLAMMPVMATMRQADAAAAAPARAVAPGEP